MYPQLRWGAGSEVCELAHRRMFGAKNDLRMGIPVVGFASFPAPRSFSRGATYTLRPQDSYMPINS